MSSFFDKAKDAAGEATEKIKDVAGEAGEKIKDVTEQVMDKVHGGGSAAGDAASDTAEQAKYDATGA